MPWLADQIGERSARGIARGIAALILDGEMPPGTRMPVVRDLALALSVSPPTVAEAWALLRADGLIGPGGGQDTVTLTPPEQSGDDQIRWETIDLEQGTPDPALLPPLETALAVAARARRPAEKAKESITPGLLAAVVQTWPFTPEEWTVVTGGAEGTLVSCQASARRGDAVAVEEPTDPRLLEILRKARVRLVPVACDDEGPKPEALARALARSPVAFHYQPRAQVPRGHSVSAARAAELARVLDEHGSATVVVEHDNLGPLATAPGVSIGTHSPARVLHVRSYCAAYGPELRSCVVAGAAELVHRVRRLSGMTPIPASRILQDAQAFLIDDPATGLLLGRAIERYAHRRAALADALRAQGVGVADRDGLFLWVPVPDETRALVTLAATGVSVAPGSPCYPGRSAGNHLRIAISRLPEKPELVADLAALVALAATGRGRHKAARGR
jgi:DNA-binding transcriptional MocR family regulator